MPESNSIASTVGVWVSSLVVWLLISQCLSLGGLLPVCVEEDGVYISFTKYRHSFLV